MKLKRKLGAAMAVMLAAGAVMADDVWLKNNATVRSDMSPAADKVVDLFKGTKVQQLEKQGNWVKIQINDKVGWVSANSVSIRPQQADSGSVGGANTAQMSSAAAAKGLEPMALQYAQNQHLSTDGVNRMEQIKKSVTPQMLRDFMAEGHVGSER